MKRITSRCAESLDHIGGLVLCEIWRAQNDDAPAGSSSTLPRISPNAKDAIVAPKTNTNSNTQTAVVRVCHFEHRAHETKDERTILAARDPCTAPRAPLRLAFQIRTPHRECVASSLSPPPRTIATRSSPAESRRRSPLPSRRRSEIQRRGPGAGTYRTQQAQRQT